MLNTRLPLLPGRRGAAITLAGFACLGAAGCGDSAAGGEASAAITAETFCSDFMAHPASERAQATITVGTAIGVQEPSNPQWETLLEGRCAAAPDLKLGDFFHHFV